MPDELIVHAYAKVNLCLDVLRRRPDGLHEVRTVLQTVSLADRLAFRPASELRLHVQGMPASADNLILRAAGLLRDATSYAAGAEIRCVKRIPIGAGLGGGSADAAATLRALNELWRCGLDRGDLRQLAGKLGADVPFFIDGGTALATGTGRDLVRLPDATPHWLALAAIEAETDTKTGEMYQALQTGDYADGSRAHAMADAIRGGSVAYAQVGTSFSRPARDRWPACRAALALLHLGGALAAAVTGAGPSVFGLFASRGAAIRAVQRLRVHGQKAHLARLVSAQ